MAKNKQSTFAIPVQPQVNTREVSPGQFAVDFDAADMQRYTNEMTQAKAQWDQTMQGVQDDPDEMFRRFLKMTGL